MRSTIRTAAILAGLIGVANVAAAQSANITAIANVFAPITVAGTQSLDFGDVFPGVSKAVAANDASSGRFSLTGQASADVNLTFTLPTQLTSGGNNMPIGSWVGLTNTTNTPAGGTSFTPSASATASAFGGSGSLFVFVGGTVTPAANQAAGTYTGTVTLTAAYF